MPSLGVVFYFSNSPRFIPRQFIVTKLIPVYILTILLPLLFYFILKNIGKVKSIYLKTVPERILPLIFNCLITLIVLKYIFTITKAETIELYFFFVGILISTMSCLVLAIFAFKASIHMVAISGLFMFFIALSIHFSININTTLAFMAIVTGATASSRLHLKAHNYTEIITGIFLGVIPQLILIIYWL